MGGKISMKKKLMSVLLAAAMVASMAVGCGSDKKASSDSGDTKKTESTEKKTESNQILFNGSSTLAPVITSIATDFFDTYGTWDAYDSSLPKEDIAIYVSAGGSGQGTKAVIDGTSTFGMVARSVKDEEKEAIKDEKEYLGYVSLKIEGKSSTWYVTDINTKYSPKVSLYNVGTGEEKVVKIEKRKYQMAPFDKDVCLRATFEMKNKCKKDECYE